jgi:KDO2-lipid IV(A) lauroyltransferase
MQPADHAAVESVRAAQRTPRIPFRKRLKNTLIYYGVRGLVALINAVPRGLALDLCGLLGLAGYGFAGRTRRRTQDNLRRAFGETLAEPGIRRMARRVFWNLGRNAVDALRLSRLSSADMDVLVKVRGLDHLEAAYRQGRGVLAVSGHMGNFELLGSYLACKGYPVTVVAAALYDPRLDALLRKNRTAGGLRVVRRDRATRAVLSALRQGQVVGLLVDQDTRVPGVFVPFFGRPAYTPTGPAVLAGRTGAPIVPMAIRRLPDDTHLVTIHPALPAPDGGRPATHAVQDTVGRYTAAIEHLIRQDPAQWVWMHERWKTRPDAAPEV